MSNRLFLILTTALAPIIWGTTYLITTQLLPAGYPFHAALFRILPAGILIILWTRELPEKQAWLKLLILGFLNMGFFQSMLFIAAYRLPGGLAATLTSTQTIMLLVILLMTGNPPKKIAWIYALLGSVGISLLVLSPQQQFDLLGIVAALAGTASTALGIYWTKSWQIKLSILSFTGWQLIMGGLFLLPVTILFEQSLPNLSLKNMFGYSYLCIGAILAYILYFRGIKTLSPVIVSSLGLLSPVCAFLLGWLFLGQQLSYKSCFGLFLVFISIIGLQKHLQPKTVRN